MRLTNARHSIHDAFAIHLGGPADNVGGGTAKFNSTRWLAQAGTAGLVIRAVMNQPAHLRGTAIFVNAPENTITQADVVAMKAKLWERFMETMFQTSKVPLLFEEQGVLIAYMDRLILGYRARMWNAKSSTHTAGSMFAGFQQADAVRLTGLANQMLDVLAAFDSDSLKPVWAVIDHEREAGRAEADKPAA